MTEGNHQTCLTRNGSIRLNCCYTKAAIFEHRQQHGSAFFLRVAPQPPTPSTLSLRSGSATRVTGVHRTRDMPFSTRLLLPPSAMHHTQGFALAAKGEAGRGVYFADFDTDGILMALHDECGDILSKTTPRPGQHHPVNITWPVHSRDYKMPLPRSKAAGWTANRPYTAIDPCHQAICTESATGTIIHSCLVCRPSTHARGHAPLTGDRAYSCCSYRRQVIPKRPVATAYCQHTR